jgi:hypothetical protein
VIFVAKRWVKLVQGISHIGTMLGNMKGIILVFAENAGQNTVTLIGIVQVVVAALIVWYAWKSKQKT